MKKNEIVVVGRKLRLRKERIQTISIPDLKVVQGGVWPTGSLGNDPTTCD